VQVNWLGSVFALLPATVRWRVGWIFFAATALTGSSRQQL
jgi:hypothetical protein